MCFLLHRKASMHHNYVLQGRLRGHLGGIVRLRATEDGRFLASGGKPTSTDGAKVWDLRTMREVRSPDSPAIRGGTTALVWIKREDDLSEALFYGTEHAAKITYQGLAVFEELSCVRIAAPTEITRGGVVQVYTLNSTMSLNEVFTIELDNFVPVAIAFGTMHGNERDVMVFGLYRGDIYTICGSNGTVTGEPWNVGAFIGDIALDARKNVLCMDEPSSGVNLYRLEERTLVKTFRVPVKKHKRLRQVALVDECQSIVSGGDNGIVYVFDRRSGDNVAKLRVDAHEWAQTVTGADYAEGPVIFAAKSRDLVGLNEIFVWRRKSQQQFRMGGIAGDAIIVGIVTCQFYPTKSALFLTTTTADVTPEPVQLELAGLRLALLHINALWNATMHMRAHVNAIVPTHLSPSRQLKSVAISLLALSPPSLPKLSDVVHWQIRSLRLLRSAAGRSTPTDYGAAEVERTQHLLDIDGFRQNLANLDVADDMSDIADMSDIDNLANVFTGLVVTDDGPDVREQQHSKLFSSRNDFQGSLPDVPLAFQPTSPSDAISSIQSLVNAAPMRTTGPTRKERRETTLIDILARVRTAHESLDIKQSSRQASS
ncbi:hypothetical protein B0H14DRAFT_3700256 [Mycena olivaceomarginata]|nr:hypothetical protein B0H14DRAFT_3700256 [Mycena olivaceomarginata]